MSRICFLVTVISTLYGHEDFPAILPLQTVWTDDAYGAAEVRVPEGLGPGAARVGEGRSRHVRIQCRSSKEDGAGTDFHLVV